MKGEFKMGNYKMMWCVEFDSNCGVHGRVYAEAKENAIQKLRPLMDEDCEKINRQFSWFQPAMRVWCISDNGMFGHVRSRQFCTDGVNPDEYWIYYRVCRRRIPV